MVALELNDVDVVILMANAVMVYQSMCRVSVLCMNDGCGDINYSMDFLHLNEALRSFADLE
jgi:hypothetical protein